MTGLDPVEEYEELLDIEALRKPVPKMMVIASLLKTF